MPGECFRLEWRAFTCPKGGHAAEEYEDAAAGCPTAGRFAVADGASESSFAAEWARLLVEGFVGAAWPAPEPLGWLPPLRERWAGRVDPLELPWFAEAKREQGAFATFLGLAVRRRLRRPARWHALAVGDSCLFLVRGGCLRRAFPLDRSAGFDDRPALIGSRPPSAPEHSAAAGRCRRGDRFYLMTDALARWFLCDYEGGGRPWEQVDPLAAGGADDFAGWVEGLRDRGVLANDDCTLIRIGL